MSTFSLFISRLVQLVGAELCKSLTREFAGQTIQFPITRDYTSPKTQGFGFPINAALVGDGYTSRSHTPLTEAEANAIVEQIVREGTRKNGKQLISRPGAEKLVRNLTNDTAFYAPPTVQATPAQQTVRPLAQPDHIAQQHLSTGEPRLPLVQGCPECMRLKDLAAQRRGHLPNRLHGLFLRAAAYFQRESNR